MTAPEQKITPENAAGYRDQFMVTAANTLRSAAENMKSTTPAFATATIEAANVYVRLAELAHNISTS